MSPGTDTNPFVLNLGDTSGLLFTPVQNPVIRRRCWELTPQEEMAIYFVQFPRHRLKA
jgi:hypothetical protein